MNAIQTVRLPMPFGPPEVNVYLVRDGEAWILVDTGMTPRPELDAALDGKRLSRILITHCHSDHCATAANLRERYNAPVAMHPADARLLQHICSGAATADLRGALADGGAPHSMIDRVLSSYHRLLATFPHLTPDEELHDGQMVGPLEVVHTPGHAPGHVCFFHREAGALISGDHVLEKITPHIGWLPGHDALGGFFRSLHRLQELPVNEILPGHGAPFTGLPEWVDEARRHHAARCAEIEHHLATGANNVADLVAKMWTKTLNSLDYQLAFTEVLAHLVYLGRRPT